jgi:hypothetical protein
VSGHIEASSRPLSCRCHDSLFEHASSTLSAFVLPCRPGYPSVSRKIQMFLPRASFAALPLIESRWTEVLDITVVPTVARLPATIPRERRNLAAREAFLRRIHAEFEGMPGLSLTLVQVTKLFGISPDAGSRMARGREA